MPNQTFSSFFVKAVLMGLAFLLSQCTVMDRIKKDISTPKFSEAPYKHAKVALIPIVSDTEPAITRIVEQQVLTKLQAVGNLWDNVTFTFDQSHLTRVMTKQKVTTEQCFDTLTREQDLFLISYYGTFDYLFLCKLKKRPDRFQIHLEVWDQTYQELVNASLSETRSPDRLSLACERGVYRLFDLVPPEDTFTSKQASELDTLLLQEGAKGYFEESFACPNNVSILVVHFKALTFRSQDEKNAVAELLMDQAFKELKDYPQAVMISFTISYGDENFVYQLKKADLIQGQKDNLPTSLIFSKLAVPAKSACSMAE